MTDRWIRTIGGVVMIIAITAIAVGIFVKPSKDLASYRLYWLILTIDGSVLLAVSLAVLLKPKKWAIAVEVGLILMPLTSITSRSVMPYIESAPDCISRDADHYIPYARYLSNQQVAIPDRCIHRDIDRDNDAYTPYLTHLSVAFSPDGQTIISGSGDGTVRLWDRQGKPMAQPFRGHESSVTSVAFSPDGKTIASGSWNGTVRLWDLQGKPMAKPFRGHESSVTSVAFSPDGKTIASGSWDGTVRLWDLQGKPIGQPFRRHETVNAVAFSPDGHIIASGSGDGNVYLWDRQGKPIGLPGDAGVRVGESDGQPFRGHKSSVISVAFSPDGQTIASGGSDNYVRLWDRHGKLMDQSLGNGNDSLNTIAFDPDGQSIAVGSDEGYVLLWDLQGKPMAKPFRGHESSVTSVAFSPDGKTIASGGRDGTVRLWNRQGSPIGQPFKVTESSVLTRRLAVLSILPDYLRQPGYPLILSMFMRITRQYNACAAELMQPLILGVLVTICILWVRRKLGRVYAAALAIPFLDPTNDMAVLSSFDLVDFLLAILFPIVAVLLFRMVLGKDKITRYFLAWLVVTFFVCSIKMVVGIIIILVCFSIFIVLCTGKLSGRVWSDRYNLVLVSKRLLLIVLSTLVISQIHTYISPGAVSFNRQAVLAMCYWNRAPNSEDKLMRKIKRIQELAEQYDSTHGVYPGVNLITTINCWLPSIYQYFPALGNYSRPLIDPDDNRILQLSPKEFEQGAYLLIKANPLAFIYSGVERAAKDYRNLFTFSRAGRIIFFYGAICSALLFIGIISLYQRYSLLTASICVAYILFFVFLSLIQVAVIRYLLPFAVFYYVAFVTGIVTIFRIISRIPHGQ